MRTLKSLKVLSLVMLASMLLAACGPQAIDLSGLSVQGEDQAISLDTQEELDAADDTDEAGDDSEPEATEEASADDLSEVEDQDELEDETEVELELETEDELELEDEDGDGEYELEGVVEAVSANQVTINGQTFTVTGDIDLTTLFAVGDSVKIHFTMSEDGAIQVLEVEVEGSGDLEVDDEDEAEDDEADDANDDDGDDQDEDEDDSDDDDEADEEDDDSDDDD